MAVLNVRAIDPNGSPVPNILVKLISANAEHLDQPGQFIYPNPRPTGDDGIVNFINASPGFKVTPSLYQAWYGDNTTDDNLLFDNSQDVEILLTVTVARPFPSTPDRTTVCGVQLTFQGLQVTINSGEHAGSYPCWFETAFQCLEYEARQDVYAAKRAVQPIPDKHIILEFLPEESIYDEPDQPFQVFISPDFESNPQSFLALVEEVIENGFIPIVAYNGDNADNPNDGYPNALRQLPILDNLFKNSQHGDIRPYILFARLWDGVFYGSTPENIQNFAQQFRILNPLGYLAIEHNTGHPPVGNGERDYQPGGMMEDYDVIMSEFNNWPATGGAAWEIAARYLGPAYVRPPDQPVDDDPRPPFYLATPNPRGPYFPIGFEWGEYFGVRDKYSPQDFINGRNYYRGLGYTYVS